MKSTLTCSQTCPTESDHFNSFFAICKVHDVNPRLWLTDVLARFRSNKPSRYEELLPHKWKPHGDPNAEPSDYYFLNQADPTEDNQS